VDQEEGVTRIVQEASRATTQPAWVKENTSTKTRSSNPEDALDHMKIPTTFSQLTTIYPTYTKKVITKLQEQLPEKSNSTYVATQKAAKAVAAMTTPVDWTPAITAAP
jgi:hypothetical protein